MRSKLTARNFYPDPSVRGDPAFSMSDIHPDADFQAFLEEGRFMIQRSRTSGEHVFYPRVLAPGSGEADLEWVAPSGAGTVYSTTVVRPKPPLEPYNVALVELAEGPRMMTRVEGVPAAEVKIGMKVRARIAKGEGLPACVVFDPATE